jgi:hypothetical protein
VADKWVDLSSLNKSRKKYKSLISVIVTLLLLILLPVGIFLVRQTQVFKPEARSEPRAAISLFRIEDLYGGKGLPVIEGDIFMVDVVVNSAATVNDLIAQISFNKDLLEVDYIYTASERGPKYCGGLAGFTCPRGYGCLIQSQEDIADAMGVCVIGDASWDDSGGGIAVPNETSVNSAYSSRSVQDGCVVTGCSGQICASEQTISTCEWRNEYSCYQYGQCKKQADGKCGWTQTPELAYCVANYGNYPEGRVCEDSGACAPGLVCDLGCANGASSCQAMVTICKKPTLKEGERCDFTANACSEGLECRPICEDNGTGALCDAYGLVCKKPRPKEPYILALYDNDDGYASFRSSHIDLGWMPQNYTVGTIVFKAKKAGQTKIVVDDSSRVVFGIANILSEKNNLDLTIVGATPCTADNQCRPDYYCDRENGPKYCAINDCPDIPGVCRPKPRTGQPGDGNGDGKVDLADLSVMFSSFFKRNPSIDLNSDGIINSIDVALLIEILKKNGVIGGDDRSCAEVITRACRYEEVKCVRAPCPPIRTCKDFPTPCDVPPGWLTVDSCVEGKMKTTSGQEYAEGRIIVGFREGVSFLQAAQLVEQKFGLKGAQLGSGDWHQFRYMTLEVPRGTVLNWLCKFEMEDIVSSAEPDYIGSVGGGVETVQACSGNADASCPANYSCIENCGPPVDREGDPPPGYSCAKAGQFDPTTKKRLNCPRCLAADTMIETPKGRINVAEIKIGQEVYSVNSEGAKVVARILKKSKTKAPDSHRVVYLKLSDGREIRVSPNHPAIGGEVVGNLKVGQIYDRAKISLLKIIPYNFEYTYDLLPDSGTGYYFANGILMASTLKE